MKKNKTKDFMIIDKIILAIVIISIAIVPLLVRVNMTQNPLSQYSWYSNEQVFFDNYSLIKSQVILVLGISSFLLILFRQITRKTFSIKDPVIILALVLSCVTILSHLTSISKEFSSSGVAGRYESTWIWLSYISIFLLVYGEKWDLSKLKKLTIAFIVSNIILSIIGILQYFGIDPVFNDFTKKFITDASMSGLNYSADYTINYKVIVQTLYHYNYVGFYLALSLPIIMSLTLYEENKLRKVGYLLLIAIMLFNLLGSSARGGLMGILAITPLFMIFNRNLIFKNYKISLALLLAVIIVFVGFESVTDGFITSRLKNIFTSIETPTKVTGIYVVDNEIEYSLDSGKFSTKVISQNQDSFELDYYLNDEQVEPILHESKSYYYFIEAPLSDIKISFSNYLNSQLILIDTYGQNWHFGYDESQTLRYVNLVGKFDSIISPKSIGFQGKERLGSSRGYIWSRTLPLILEKPLLGYGVEIYPIVFPQQDYVGKYNAYSTTNMVIDKPHNLFLQIAMNSGLIALSSFVGLVLIALYRTSKMLTKSNFKFNSLYYSSLSLSIIAYIIASMFNDSTVHVSTVFWVFLGLLLIPLKDSIKR